MVKPLSCLHTCHPLWLCHAWTGLQHWTKQHQRDARHAISLVPRAHQLKVLHVDWSLLSRQTGSLGWTKNSTLKKSPAKTRGFPMSPLEREKR